MIIYQIFILLTFKNIYGSSPFSLKKCSMNAIDSNIQDCDIYRIAEKIYPDLFNANIPLQNSGFMNIFFREIPYDKEVNTTGDFEIFPPFLVKINKFFFEYLNLFSI